MHFNTEMYKIVEQLEKDGELGLEIIEYLNKIHT